MISDEVAKKDLITVRPYSPGDYNFIIATFLRGLYYGDSWFSLIPKKIFMTNYHIVAERLLKHPNLSIRIACLKDDPDVILGYSVSRNINEYKILDWIFVKSSWRRIGIAKSLLPSDINTVSHLTTVGKAIKPPHYEFNPFV